MKFVMLCSSRGTTMQAVLDAIGNGELEMECLGLISDKEDRGCVEKAKEASIPVVILGEQKDKETRDKKLDAAIRELGGSKENTVIALLGWMFIFTPWFIEQWSNRIINVHPALLPKYGGKGMYGMHVHEHILAAGEAQSGMTIHIVDEGVDTGPILMQQICEIDSNETPESLRKKAQALEKEWYPKLLQMIESGAVKL